MSFSLSEYTKIDVGWGFTPDPTGGAYSGPPGPGPLLVSRGPLRSRRGMKGRTRRRGKGGEVRGKGECEGREKGGG